jgi:hypothetical protein
MKSNYSNIITRHIINQCLYKRHFLVLNEETKRASVVLLEVYSNS